MNKMMIILKNVYKKNIKSLAFLIMAIAPFIILGIFYVTQNTFGNGNEVSKIGVVGVDSSIAENNKQNREEGFELSSIADENAAKTKLEKKKIDGYILMGLNDQGIDGKVYSLSSLGSDVENSLNQFINQMQLSFQAQKLNLPNTQVKELVRPATFSVSTIKFKDGKMEKETGDSKIQVVISFLTTMIMFIFIMTYSSIIAQEIASEKGTRIMEVLISSMRAQAHFYGKLLGILLVAFTQLIIYIVALILGYKLFGNVTIIQNIIGNLSIGNIFEKNILIIIAFLVFGILLYSVLAALCGSLVNKPEDTAKAIQPVMYISFIGYMLDIVLGVANPSNTIFKVASYIPFISSYCMPVRIATNSVEFSEVIISLVVLIFSTVALTIISSRLYKSNILVYNEKGGFSTLKESLLIIKSEKASVK